MAGAAHASRFAPLRVAGGRHRRFSLVARRQLVEDARLRSPRPEERAQLADLLFQALEPPHLAAETNHFFDELCYISFRAI